MTSRASLRPARNSEPARNVGVVHQLASTPEKAAAIDAAGVWFPVKIGNAWRLSRDHDCRDEREAGFFHGGNPRPLELNGDDAKALAEALNKARFLPGEQL